MLHAKNPSKLNGQAARALLAAILFAPLAAPLAAQTDQPKPNTKPLKSLFIQSPATAPQPGLAPPNAKMTSEQTIAEIEALRKRMGGGVGEQLKGVLPGVDPNEKFRQQLENLTRSSKSSPPAKPPTAQTPFLSSSTQPLFSNIPARLPPPPAAQPSQQEVLRTSAADLERIAANMEAAKLYEQADQLRSAAESFWQKARDLD